MSQEAPGRYQHGGGLEPAEPLHATFMLAKYLVECGVHGLARRAT